MKKMGEVISIGGKGQGKSFLVFCNYIRSHCLHFREEWDDEHWHEAYIDFIDWQRTLKVEYVADKIWGHLIQEWAEDFYIPAHPDTHDYWLQSKYDRDGLDKRK
jgi:hypothetical protein